MTARKRLTVEGDWALEGDLWVQRSAITPGAKVAVGVIPREAVVSVEDIPDPLPTESGTVLDALVTVGGISERRVVVRSDDSAPPGRRLVWFSARKIDGVAWLADERLSDWRVIPTGPPTPEPEPATVVLEAAGIPEPTEVGARVRDSDGDLWVRAPGASNWKCVTDPIPELDWSAVVEQYGPLELVTP